MLFSLPDQQRRRRREIQILLDQSLERYRFGNLNQAASVAKRKFKRISDIRLRKRRVDDERIAQWHGAKRKEDRVRGKMAAAAAAKPLGMLHEFASKAKTTDNPGCASWQATTPRFVPQAAGSNADAFFAFLCLYNMYRSGTLSRTIAEHIADALADRRVIDAATMR